MTRLPDSIPFWKMSGAGNDFILIDNRTGLVSADEIRPRVPRLCAPHVSLGADGLILIESASGAADFKWRFFNADGSEAEMCGNGARCAARFAHLNGIAPARMTFETIAGPIQARVEGGRVRVRLTEPRALALGVRLPIEGGTDFSADFVNTGVPHAVVFVDDPGSMDVSGVGRAIRFHPEFAPAGANANFVRVDGRHAMRIRTYERGVEGETLACGTGSVASAVVAAARGLVASPVTLAARSGIDLTVHFARSNGTFGEIDLEGDARIVCKGELTREAWE